MIIAHCECELKCHIVLCKYVKLHANQKKREESEACWVMP